MDYTLSFLNDLSNEAVNYKNANADGRRKIYEDYTKRGDLGYKAALCQFSHNLTCNGLGMNPIL
jgi:hypothetical protein